MELVCDFDLKKIGGKMGRQRYQRGSLQTFVPAAKGKAKRQLPRGSYWARWYRYIQRPDGVKRSPREKIITKDLAKTFRIAIEYTGPLTKSDAQRVLDLLINRDAGTYTPPDTSVTFRQIARDYLATVEPGWGAHTLRTSKNLIEYALIGGKLGSRPVVELTEIDLQQFLNDHVTVGASRSKLSKLLLSLRNILDHAVMKKIIASNPARNPGYRLKAKSRRAVSQRYLSIEECRRLLVAVPDGPHLLILRILIQLGLRPEELFALRCDDVIGDTLRIDEAIVDGASSTVKTEASDASVYIPRELRAEINDWLRQRTTDPRGWLFPSPKGRPWRSQNYLNRVLKPAAFRARVGLFVRRTRRGTAVETTDVNFQVLRRTCGTLFGAKAKDPRDTQAQLRHADPYVTLRHYQKSIPNSVRAAAEALETELMTPKNTEPIEQVLNRLLSEERG
jgi:integrase